jgi:hypothetical protein
LPDQDAEPAKPEPEQALPPAKAQRNFTDSESRIMHDGANKGNRAKQLSAIALFPTDS